MKLERRYLIGLVAVFISWATVLHGKVICEKVPLTEADVFAAKKWNVDLADCITKKVILDFGIPVRVTIHSKGAGSSQDRLLNGRNSQVTILTFYEKEGGPYKQFHFFVSGESGAIGGYVSFNASKMKAFRSYFSDGRLKIEGAENENFAAVLFQVDLTGTRESEANAAGR